MQRSVKRMKPHPMYLGTFRPWHHDRDTAICQRNRLDETSGLIGYRHNS
jgi:hypothetical protein